MISGGDPEGVRFLANTFNSLAGHHADASSAFDRMMPWLSGGDFAGPQSVGYRSYHGKMQANYGQASKSYAAVAKELPNVASAIERANSADTHLKLAKQAVTTAQNALNSAQTVSQSCQTHPGGLLSSISSQVFGSSHFQDPAVAHARDQLHKAEKAEKKAQTHYNDAENHLHSVCRHFRLLCNREAATLGDRPIPVPPNPSVLVADGYGLLAQAKGYNPLTSFVANNKDWQLLVNGPKVCYAHGHLSYGGGGYIKGPDGKLYPLVVPNVPNGHGGFYTQDADAYNNYVDSLKGQDPGWWTVYKIQGAGQVLPAQDKTWPKVVGGALGASGVQVPKTILGSPAEDRRIFFDSNLPVWAGPQASAASSSNASVLNTTPKQYWNPSTGEYGPTLARPKTAAGMTGTSMAASGLQGAANVQTTLTNNGYGAYQIVFQQNPDGHRRAMMTMVQTVDNPPGGDNKVDLIPTMVGVDKQGVPYHPAGVYYKPAPPPPATLTAPGGGGVIQGASPDYNPGYNDQTQSGHILYYRSLQPPS